MRPVSVALSVIQNRCGAATAPAWCTYLVTYRCNARCKMCDSWRMRPGGEMIPAEVEAVFRKIGRLDIVRVSGGEPFLRQDLPEIGEAILRASNPIVLHITTNGSFPDRVESLVGSFSQPRKLRFMVSFDGLAAEHDANRGKHVTFATAMETVRVLVRLRERHGLEVSANHTVISPQSLEDHEGLRKLLGEVGVDVHAVLAYADSAMYGAKLRGTRAEHLIVPTGYPLHPMLNGADVVGFTQRELGRAGRLRDPWVRLGKRYYLRGLLARLQQEPRPRPKPPCVELRSHIRLLPNGGVPVCQFNTEQVGNLREQTLEELWHAPRTKQARKWVTDCPGCWAECEVMPNAVYSGDLLKL